MWMPDVFYAYCWLRYKAMGHELPLSPQSPYVKDLKFDMIADLRTLEVEVPETLDSLLWDYKLKKPIKIRGHEITDFKMGPQRWANVERMDNADVGAAKAAVIAGCIHRLPDDHPTKEVAVSEAELDVLGKIDIENLAKQIDDRGAGPIMRVKAICPKTKREFDAPIDWRYDQFFGTGSQ